MAAQPDSLGLQRRRSDNGLREVVRVRSAGLGATMLVGVVPGAIDHPLRSQILDDFVRVDDQRIAIAPRPMWREPNESQRLERVHAFAPASWSPPRGSIARGESVSLWVRELDQPLAEVSEPQLEAHSRGTVLLALPPQ